MRKIVVLAVAVMFFAGVATAYAQQEVKERNLIKIIQKSIEKPVVVKEKDKLRGDIAKMTCFQSSANWIKEGSARARGTPSQKEQNLIKIVQGTIKPGEGKEKNMVKGEIGKVENFQSAADWVNSGPKCADDSRATK